MTTPNTERESSLDDALAASLAEVEETVEEEIVEAPEETAEVSEEEVAEAVAAALEPAPKWDRRYKEVFTELGQLENGTAYQQAWLDNYNDEQKYKTQIEQERADLRKRWEQAEPFVQRMQEAIAPYHDFIAQSGMSPDAAVRQALGAIMSLRANPKAGLLDLAKRLGVDLQQELSEQPWRSPESEAVEELRRELDRMRQEQKHREQYEVQSRMQRIQQENASQIEAFATAVDDDGNPKYPHFEAVENVMAELIYGRNNLRRTNPDVEPMSLEEAYERACKLSPEVSEEMDKRREAERLAEANAKAKRAADAAKRVKTGKAGNVKPQKSIDEMLDEGIAQQVA